MAKLGRDLLSQCGTVEVRAAPLLVLIGSAMSRDSEYDSIVEMLDPEGDDEAD